MRGKTSTATRTNKAQVKDSGRSRDRWPPTGSRITIYSWQMSHPSGSQPPGGRRTNSRRRSIHAMKDRKRRVVRKIADVAAHISAAVIENLTP